MRNMLKMTLVAAALATLGSAGARAAFLFENKTAQPVWYTVYDWKGSGIKSGCIMSRQLLDFTDIKNGAIVYLRGELKNGRDCGGSSVGDTGRGSPISVQGAASQRSFLRNAGAQGRFYIESQ